MKNVLRKIALGVGALVLLGLVSIGALVGWNSYQEHKRLAHEARGLSFLADEFVKPGDGGKLYYEHDELDDYPPPVIAASKPIDQGANEQRRAFVLEHEAEMNAFIWDHQNDPRIEGIQQVLFSWSIGVKLTCKQMKEGVKPHASNYDLFKAGCIKD